MPIYRRVQDSAFAPEHIQAMVQALEETLTRIGLVNRDDRITQLVAKEIIELAQQGECDPVKLREQAVMAFTVRKQRAALR